MVSPREQATEKARRDENRPLILVIAIMAFAASIAGAFVISTKAIGLAIVITLAMTLILAACLFAMRSGDRYRVVHHSGDIDFDAMASMLGAGSFLHAFAMSTPRNEEIRMAGYVSNPTVDRLFVTNPYHAEIIGMYELPDMLVPYERYLLADIEGDPSIPEMHVGEEVVGLAGDLTTTMLSTGQIIPVTVASSYDVTITDHAFDRVVATTGLHGTILFDGCSMSIAEGGFLLPTSQSGNVNEIQVHSIICTEDGYMAFMEGTHADPGHEGRLVPSASCSLHASDITSTETFQDALILALHNATRRLYSLDPTVPIGSSPLGLARIIERNGATEFYAITRVGRTMGQLIASHDNTLSVPASNLMKPWFAGAQDANQLADLMARATYTLMDSTSISMSVSMAGLASALFEGLGNAKLKNKIMQRLGYGFDMTDSASQADDPSSNLKDIVNTVASRAMSSDANKTATGDTTGAMMMARKITFGNAGGMGKDGRDA